MVDIFGRLMPEQASNWAARVDWINSLISYASVFCTVAITGTMLFFAWRYRRRSDDQVTEYITHDAVLETVWTAIPTIVVVAVFYYGFAVYREMRTPPSSALEINVQASKWRWDFTYPNGKKSAMDLVVPVDKPVRLIMTSSDVIHSFFLPQMRVKEDVVPGTYSYLWFIPNKLGQFHIFCAEYCGTNHSQMLGTLKVVTPAAFADYLLDRKLEAAPSIPPAERGKELFAKNCTACHSIDGSRLVGPSLKGLFAGEKRGLEDGSSIAPDENYFRESVLNPQAKIVAGFKSTPMQSFQGMLSEEDLTALIAYIKTLK